MSRFPALCFAVVLTLTTGILPGSAAAPRPGGPPPESAAKTMSRKAGQAFCPSAALVYRSIVIPGGRCYLMSVLRDTRGIFLAFAPEDTHIPPGQLVRLNTPAGSKLKGKLLLVPIYPVSISTPMNTVTLVAAEFQEFGARLAITVVGTPVPNLVVIFNIGV